MENCSKTASNLTAAAPFTIWVLAPSGISLACTSEAEFLSLFGVATPDHTLFAAHWPMFKQL